MRVLFHIGYFKNDWNPDNMSGIGGTEIAVIEITKRLARFGWDVTVSGDVIPGVFDGVKWLQTETIHRDHYDQFDVIIGVSYIHFVPEFREYNAKKLFWIHNTDYHPWYRGKKINEANTLLSPDNIDGFICLTNWHADQWSQKYSLDRDRFHIIGNGINMEEFLSKPEKIKDRFIWSSAPERGLSELLDNWKHIKSVKPDATLHIYSPSYQIAESSAWGREGLDGVEFKGSVNQKRLHLEMMKAEYWFYVTDYEETYCITALEMQAAGILPIVTNVAALSETVNSGIILENNETKWKFALQIISSLEPQIKEKALDENKEWIKLQTWNSRVYDWKRLIEGYESR